MPAAPDHRALLDRYDLGAGAADLLAALAERPGQPLVLVNHFALRPQAAYADHRDEPCTGVEAMLRYSAVSGERLAAVGGRFLHQGFHLGGLWGDDDPWDLVVVAHYPSPAAFTALLDDESYHDAYRHRRAAVARQRVTVSTPFV